MIVCLLMGCSYLNEMKGSRNGVLSGLNDVSFCHWPGQHSH